MPKFSSGYVSDASDTYYARALRASIQFAAQVEQACLNVNVPAESQAFVRGLAAYLGKRKTEERLFSMNIEQITQRANFIAQLVPLIISDNVAAQLELLKEANIKPFKGYFSKRFYKALVGRRETLQLQLTINHRVRPING